MPLSQILQEQFDFFQYLDFFARILVACLCGALVGFERSKRFKEAGIRTHIVVCCAAALMMLVSKYAYVDLADSTGLVTLMGTKGADPSRIASQVVTGISFLGAGVIFKQGGTVKGLTTAAGLWATAGIGLAVGAGMYILGLFTTVTLVLLQILMHRFNIGGDSLFTTHLVFTVEETEGFQELLDQFMTKNKIQVSDLKVTYLKDDMMSYDMVVRMPVNVSVTSWDRFLHEIGHVQQISYTSAG